MSTLFKKIAVVGDVMADEYLFGESERISPEFPTAVIRYTRSEIRCGAAANVAICLSELTHKLDLYFTSSTDIYSKKISKILKKKNINLIYNEDNKLKTTVKKRIYVGKNQITRIDYDNFVNKNKSNFLINKLIKNIKRYNAIIISDYGKGQVTDNIKKLINLAHRNNVKTIIDPYGNNWQKYNRSFCLTPNKKEFENIAGKINDKKDLIKKSINLIRKLNIKSLIVTLGNEGMFTINNKKQYYFHDAIKKQVFDVTGAGDIVCAVYTYFLSKNFSQSQSTLFSNQFASIGVSKLGSSSVSTDEYFKNFVNYHNENKLINIDDIDDKIKFYKAINKKIIFTNGCFDIIHAGHLDYLKKSKKLGDILVVAINSDKSVFKLKGKNRPINNLHNRIKILKAFEFIDHLIIFDELDPLNLIKKIEPNIITKGNGYKKNMVIGYNFLKKIGGDVKILKSKINQSSTKILDNLK